MDKLLPCPFCGGRPAVALVANGETAVTCPKPVLECPGSRIVTSPGAWNTRHTPEGWQLVPVELTEDMYREGCDAGETAYADADGIAMGDAWPAMLAAAPKWGGE